MALTRRARATMAAEHPIKLGGYAERLGLKRKVCELGGEVIWGQGKGKGGSMKVAGSSSAASPQTPAMPPPGTPNAGTPEMMKLSRRVDELGGTAYWSGSSSSNQRS